MKKFFIGFSLFVVVGIVIYGFMIGSGKREKQAPVPSMIRLQACIRSYYQATGSVPSGIDVLINSHYISESELKDKSGKTLGFSYNSETGKCRIVCSSGNGDGSEEITLEFDPALSEENAAK